MIETLRRFRGELIAFWYGYRHAFYLLVPVFLIADLILPINPGNSVRLAGTLAVLFMGFAIAFWDDPNMEWRAEVPRWSCPVMLGILFVGWYLLMVRHDLTTRFFSSAFQFF